MNQKAERAVAHLRSLGEWSGGPVPKPENEPMRSLRIAVKALEDVMARVDSPLGVSHENNAKVHAAYRIIAEVLAAQEVAT
jgi:hypothetical protein